MGCGLGTFIRDLYQIFPAGNYLGVDHNPSVIEYAKKLDHPFNLSFQCDKSENFLGKTERKFNTIFFERVLHCLTDARITEVLDKCFEKLEAEGKIIIVTPDFKSQNILPISETTTKILNYYFTHCTTNPVSPDFIYTILYEECQIRGFNLSQKDCIITTQSFDAVEKDLCLIKTVENAIKDNYIDEETGQKWLEELQAQSEEVSAISTMCIYMLSK